MTRFETNGQIDFPWIAILFVKLCVSTTFLYLLRVTFVSRSDIYASTSIYIQAV